jgi:pimeloyl-ACP methyl ester carboxylesterase
MKKHFILVHGAWHGGWCWQGVMENLKKHGHSVEAPTMPGHLPDDDRSGIRFDDYTSTLKNLLNQHDQPVILVGHSSAGMLLQSVASKMPEKIEHLIYNNSFVLPNGKCQFDVVPPDIAEGMTAAANASPDNSVPVMEDFVLNSLMAGDPPELQEKLINNLVPQPLSLFTTPIDTIGYDDSQFKSTVLFCNKDVSLPEGAYIGMANVLENYDLKEIAVGHEGLFTNPDMIAKALIESIA